jgi:hypothetical protein
MLEVDMKVASKSSPPPPKVSNGPRGEALRIARTCYVHLAGRLGVAIADALAAKGVIDFGDDGGIVSSQGIALLDGVGMDIASLANRSGRPMCRPCLDWSEQRPHVAGKLGAAICMHFMEKKFVMRMNGTRALVVAPSGWKALRDMFDIREF